MTDQPAPCKPCRTSYTCGGMYSCGSVLACIRDHYRHECGHDFTGPFKEGAAPGGGHYGSTTCRHCGLLAIDHDQAHGP
jgi:hypothetical protein